MSTRLRYEDLATHKQTRISRASWERLSGARQALLSSKDVEILDAEVEVLKAAPADKDSRRRFALTAYTGIDFPRMWGRLVIDMDGFSGDLPMGALLEHDDRTPIGVYDERYFEGEGDKRRLRLEGYMLSNKDAKDVAGNASEGFPYKASVGVRILKFEELGDEGEAEVNGRKLKGPLTIARKARLFETSFIAVNPADLSTEVEVEARGQEEVRCMAQDEAAPASAAHEPVEQATDDARISGAVEKALTAERARGAAILLAFPKSPKFAAKQAAAGKTLAQAKEAYADLVLTGKIKPGQTRKNEIDRLAESLAFPGMGFDARARQAGTDSPPAGDVAQLNFEERDQLFSGKTLEERSKIEVGRDNRLAAIFRDYTYDVKARDENGRECTKRHSLSGERMYEKCLAYARKTRRDGFSPLVSETEIEKLAAAVREISDPRFGPINYEKLGTALGTPTGGSWRKDGPDYSKITVKGFLGAFWMRFEMELAGLWAAELGFRVESDQETETHRFLGGAPQLSEWLDGVQEDGLLFFEIQQTNKLYSSAVSVDAQDWIHQKHGLITARFGEQGAIAAEHWNELFTIMLNTNATSYDTKSFFNTAHTFGGQSGSNNNDIDSTVYPALHVTDPTQPTLTEMAQILMVAVPHMRRFVWNNGVPINGGARRFAIMVPQSMEGVAFAATRTDRLNFGEGNPLFNQEYSYEVVPNPRLTMTTNTLTPLAAAAKTLYIFRLDANTNKPAIIQEPGPPQLLFQGPGSYREYMKNSYGFKIKTSRSLGPGAWESAVRVTLS